MGNSPNRRHSEREHGDTVDLGPSFGANLFQQLLTSSLIASDDLDQLPSQIKEKLGSISSQAELLPQLTHHGLLTGYQAERIQSGMSAGLIMGNYRILEKIGAGSMGVVYMAEHVDLRRVVAIKVLTISALQDQRLLSRFNSEIRAVSRLQHPNIVAAIDAGKFRGSTPDSPEMRYFVMEYVPGRDLEEIVSEDGSLAPMQACDLIHQIASALAEASKHNLVHRDIKPSNIRVTDEGQAKLLDFGLALNWNSRMTLPGTLLGTLDYVAPEQAADAGSVDIRADIYGLGGTLYWCLTGSPPFSVRQNAAEGMVRRAKIGPPSVRARRPEISEKLDSIVARMMAIDPADRFPTPEAVMEALVPFLNLSTTRPGSSSSQSKDASGARIHRVLIIDDSAQVRELTAASLKSKDLECDQAANGEAALRMVRESAYDLVVLDVDLPGMSGHEVCRQLRQNPPSAHLKIIMFSGRASTDEMSQIMNDGADDFISKPFSVIQLQARVRAALRLKDAQERSETLNERLFAANRQLETNISSRDADFSLARRVMVLALAELVDIRNSRSPPHMTRMQLYCRRLADEASHTDCFRNLIDDSFIAMLECCVPLRDIGYATLPDHILAKPGSLSLEEQLFIQTHTTMGAEMLQKTARKHGLAGAFVQTAVDIIRHHHERFDGAGYPDRLSGDNIPVSARIVAIADVYDALRSRRCHKPPLSHNSTVAAMLNQCTGQFDPFLLQLFKRCEADFQRIFKDTVE